jgi:hypothetical protein
MKDCLLLDFDLLLLVNMLVFSNSTSGKPYSGASIRVRGSGLLQRGESAICGDEYIERSSSALENFDMNDVESIEIFKEILRQHLWFTWSKWCCNDYYQKRASGMRN